MVVKLAVSPAFILLFYRNITIDCIVHLIKLFYYQDFGF